MLVGLTRSCKKLSLEEYWEIWSIHLGMLFTKQEYYKNCFTRRFAKSRIGDA